MKAASLFVAGLIMAMLSMAPANAAPTNAAPWVGCSASSGMTSRTCKNRGNWTAFSECMELGLKIGWRSSEYTWYCSALRLK